MQRFLLERFARGALPSFLASWVEGKIAADDGWARAYHELRVLERALHHGDDDALSAAQLAKITGAVLGQSAGATRTMGIAPRLAIFGAAAAVACLAVLFVVRGGGNPEDDGGDALFHARGGAAHGGVHARCVDAARKKVLAEADVADGAELRCPRGGLIAFSATNTGDETLYVSGVAVADDADSAALFTLPFEGEPAFAVPGKSVDLPLPRGFPLDDAARSFHIGAVLVAQPPSGPQPAPGAAHTLHVVVVDAGAHR